VRDPVPGSRLPATSQNFLALGSLEGGLATGSAGAKRSRQVSDSRGSRPVEVRQALAGTTSLFGSAHPRGNAPATADFLFPLHVGRVPKDRRAGFVPASADM